MGGKAIFSVLCWLTLSRAFGDRSSVTQSAIVKENESASSGPRLYRNVPVSVYASSAPYASYSFHLPQFIATPKPAASQVTPVKQKPVNQNINTYLMDSYGNRFLETPHLASYKTAFPQQYVSLQTKLPDHLAQPLVAASPNFQFKQSGPQVFYGAPFRVSALQIPAPTPLNQFPSFGHLVYADKVQSLSPTSNVYNFGFGAPKAQQQSTNNNAVFTNTQHEQYSNVKIEPKFQRQQELPQIIVGKPKYQNVQEISQGETNFQRIQEVPHAAHGEVKFQRIQEKPQAAHDEVKYHRIQKAPQEGHDRPRYQRLQEQPQEHSNEHLQGGLKHQDETSHPSKNDNTHLQATHAKQTTITYVNDNGKTSIVKVKSKPLPLLDLTLLEPLTFDNPLVPQVQHFLPRINQATYQKLPEANIDGVQNYQKEFVVQKTMSYDSGNISDNLQKDAPKKKQKKPTQLNKQPKKNDAPKRTTVTSHSAIDDAPEIVYEINAPGRKEIYKEKVISYNKETQPEPVHYSYGSQSESDPVNYSYTRSTKEPVQVKEVHYHSNGKSPQHLIYNFKPREQHREHQFHNTAPNSHSEGHEDTSKSLEKKGPGYHQLQNEHYHEHPKSSEERHTANQREQQHYQRPSQENGHESVHGDPTKYYTSKAQNTGHFDFAPTTNNFEEEIRLLANAQIKVDPSQHIQQPKSTTQASRPQNHEQSLGIAGLAPHRYHQTYSQQNSQSSPAPPQNHQSSSDPSQGPQTHHYYSSPQFHSHAPVAHVHEKSKRVIIQEETPEDQRIQEEADGQEENEEEFERAYKNAAIGFPAYSKEALDIAEKEIFDPESYGVPPDHVEYDIENTPLQQYQKEGDDFPKESRASYKNSRDKMKENYYMDYSLSKPESLLDRYQNKLGYYKLYKQQKPEYFVTENNDEEDTTKHKSKFAKYTAAPTFEFPATKENKGKSYYGHHTPKQPLYEYDYSKAPHDSSAFASRPYQRYKGKTNFVEPQFQYGFEPISIPKLLDSELAAMASNHSPESDKQGMRKKVYKENWYIKKTSSSAGAPAS